MHPPLAGEVVLLARVLLLTPAAEQASIARGLLLEVESAFRHFCAHQKCHPAFGDGSLMGRLLPLCPPAEPLATDAAFLTALSNAAVALRTHLGQ
jgi:hypothetical protein